MGGRRSAFEMGRPRLGRGRVALAVALLVGLLAPGARGDAAGAATATAASPSAAQQAVPIDTATLVRTTATSAWIPGSPDPAGVAWMPGPDRLVVVDSEVDETTGAGWNNVNIWFTQRDGTMTGTGAAWGINAAQFDGAQGYSREPTGVRFDPTGNVLFISDDAAGSVFVVRAGTDAVFGNTDDVVTAIDTAAIGDLDAEDPVYDPVSGHLFVLDGMGTEVYRINPVDGVFGNGNDTVTHFDIGHLGPTDFEGMARDPSRGTLYVGSRTTRQIFEVAIDGTHLRTINVPSATGLRSISGLEVAPSSTTPGQSNIFIVDRAIDNGADATENDGKLFEVTAPGVAGPLATAPGAPTTVTAVKGDRSAVVSWVAPVSNGGSPVIGYVVTPYDEGVAESPVVFGSGTTQTVTGLTNGVGYSFRVRAVNAMGTGPSSGFSNVVVPGPLLDPTWSTDGIATLQTKYQPALRGLAGGRLAVGLYKDGDGGAFRLWKLNETGGPLATYGGGLGYVKRSFAAGGVSFPDHVLSYGTDEIVVGSYQSATRARLGVARLREDGSYKVIGSTPGRNIYKVFANEHDYLEPFAAEVLSNGRLMVAVAAFRYNSAGSPVYMGQAIIKLNNNGSMDRTFSGDGILPVAKNVGDITFGPDGSLFLGRKVGNSHEIRKFTPTGALDPTFSGDGNYLVPCGAHYGADLEADTSGRVLVICDRVAAPSLGADLRLIRVTSQGILDPTYSGNGMAPLLLLGDSDNWSVHVEDSVVHAASGSSSGTAIYAYGVDETGEPSAINTGTPIPLPAQPEILDLAVTDGRLIVASGRGVSALDLIAVSI